MIDFIKIWYNLEGKNFSFPYDSPLQMFGTHDTGSGECFDDNFGSYKKGLQYKTEYSNVITQDGKVSQVPSYLEIKVSLHKMSNDFKHNHNDFTYLKLIETIDTLCLWFGIPANKMRLVNLEFGMNLKLGFPTSIILDNLILNGRGPFVLRNEKGFKYKQSEHSKKIVKCYDKGMQNKLPYHLLRIENKYAPAERFKKMGIHTVEDLKDMQNLENLKEDLLRTWSKTILYEPPLVGPNSPKEENQLLKWQNLNYWKGLESSYRNKFARERKKFDEYIQNKTEHNKKVIHDLLESSWTTFKNAKEVQISPLYIVDNCTTQELEEKRLCKITGIDISHQKQDSTFVSTKTVMKIFHTNPRKFKSLFNSYLKSKKGNHLCLLEICKRISHNVRNSHWNLEYRKADLPATYKNSLFPV